MPKFNLMAMLSIAILSACQKPTLIEPTQQKLNYYLHLSRTRTNTNARMDSIVERVDYQKFDMLWLGGDLASLTSLNDQIMDRVDSIFDIGSERTIWTLGNHDDTNLMRIQEYTHRPAYYTTHYDGITIVNLSTEDSSSSILGPQKDFLIGVLDTIETSSHLIILHHKLIWMYNHVELSSLIPAVSNAGVGACSYCLNPNNFNHDIYPALTKVRKKGIQVLCIGGDVGSKVKAFEYRTSEDIYFLASGISAGHADNKALLFEHNPNNRDLSWEFVLLHQLKKK